ncbi:hypothetical protein HMPREF0402_04216 [Fusobacterium ulcerans 12-1B]|uniref:TIR domain-containing protein n=2 Tax=Fusobacterium ulcerans TaxID=861 RepID=S2LPX3_9FUSO|nr:hypothetical protein HMPREF0402_04216 [Fusobacterium ulcerans 12-1B]
MKIFISYNWKNEDEMKIIDEAFKKKGIIPTLDKRDLKYKQSLEEFMEQIREHDFAILLISHNYLLSENCMYEFLQVLKERTYRDKILPIILVNDFFNGDLKMYYIKEWRIKKVELENKIKNFVADNILEDLSDHIEKLKKYKAIENDIGDIISNLQKSKMITFTEEEQNNFKTLFEEIGIDNNINFSNISTDRTNKGLKKQLEPVIENYIGSHTVTDEEINKLFEPVVEKPQKKNIDFKMEKEKFLKGFIDDDVALYIKFLSDKDILCKFIVKYGKKSVEGVSKAVILLNKTSQKQVMTNILDSHQEATGYCGWDNYDLFGFIALEVYHSSDDKVIQDLAHSIIKNCSYYRQHFEDILQQIDMEEYI